MISTRQPSGTGVNTTLTLFFCPGHMSFAPHVILNELKTSFELVHVSIKDGGTQTDDFRRLNPKGKVPVLTTGPQVLTEASAILTYLALSHPESRLLPETPLGIARALEWMNWLGAILSGSVGLNFHPARFTTDEQGHPGIRRKGRESILANYAEIDNRLNGREWAMGEGYSVVDPMLLIFFKWGNMLDLNMHGFPQWERHTLRMLDRPAVMKTLKSEGISIWQ